MVEHSRRGWDSGKLRLKIIKLPIVLIQAAHEALFHLLLSNSISLPLYTQLPPSP